MLCKSISTLYETLSYPIDWLLNKGRRVIKSHHITSLFDADAKVNEIRQVLGLSNE